MKASLLIFTAAALLAASSTAQLIGTAPAEPAADQLAADSIVTAINSEIAHRVAVHKICFDTLWRNTRPAATPAAILARLGTNAKLVFAFAAENLDHIDRCAQIIGKTRVDFIPDADCIPPLAFTLNEDGSATINP